MMNTKKASLPIRINSGEKYPKINISTILHAQTKKYEVR
jgi:hypothetical protein